MRFAHPRTLFLFAIILATAPIAADAVPALVKGDPLHSVVPLAGIWSITDAELTPSAATQSRLADWGNIRVPGKWLKSHFVNATTVWYGIDVQFSQRPAVEGAPAFSVALPDFLFAYEVYAGGERIGASGRMPPHLEWGAFRHEAYPVPARLVGDDGVLRLRVHVGTWSGFGQNGTHGAAVPEAVAIGPTEDIARLVELSLAHQRSDFEVQQALACLMLGMGLVFLALFLLTPAQRELGYYAASLTLASLAIWVSEPVALGQADRPYPLNLLSGGIGALGWTMALLVLGRVLELRGPLFHSIIGLQGLVILSEVVRWIAPQLLERGNWYDLAVTVNYLLLIIYGLVSIARRARENHPDARLVFTGFTLMLAVFGFIETYRLMTPVLNRSVVGQRLQLLGIFGNVVYWGTMALMLARRYRRTLDDLSQTLQALDRSHRELQLTHAAALRFVPDAFLNLLDRKSLTDIQRGDQVELELSVVFSDIRGFTTLSEQLGAKETFAMINDYLAFMEPALHRHGVVIANYLGDGIMALGHRSADEAVRAGVDMQQEVARFNAQQAATGRRQVVVGVGIHTGRCMVGAIGGKERLACTLISDAVNLASRIESLTKQYAAPLLVSDATVAKLEDREAFQLREVDVVVAKGRVETTTLYEVLDAEPAEVRSRKLADLPAFAAALEQYRAGHLAAARDAFGALAGDAAAELYVERCDEGMAGGAPVAWSAVTYMQEK